MAGSNTKVLVVDDLEDNRVLLRRRLENDGMTVEEAQSGEAALEMIEQVRYDLILLDINMPGIGGVEVLKKIRAQFPQGKLPVMMLTASNQISDVLEARKGGANDYITKPIDFSIAMPRIRAALGSGPNVVVV